MPARLAASAFNQLGQYANSPGHCRAYCPQNSPFSSLGIASTHSAYPRRDGQAELAWVTWLNTKSMPANGHPSQY